MAAWIDDLRTSSIRNRSRSRKTIVLLMPTISGFLAERFTADILYTRDGRAIFWFGNGAKGHRVQKSCVGGRPFSLVAEQRPSFVCRWATF